MFVPFLSLISQSGVDKQAILDSLHHEIDSFKRDIKELDALKKNVEDQREYHDSVTNTTPQYDTP